MLIFLVTQALAREGMWEPAQLPSQARALAEAGFSGDAAALARLDAAPLGAVVSLGGCTASFVSPDGLLATNHHCVTGYLQQASKEGEDLIDAGFLARTRGEERSVGPGGRVYVTTSVQDVTADVIGKLPRKLEDAVRVDRIEEQVKKLVAACEKPKDTRCRVASFYGGSVHRLITMRELKDLRLVMAPPDSVGNYGDEIDNWHWPRHAGDFAFLRAYVGKDGASAPFAAENVPYRPPMHLGVEPKGVSPGDFVMVAGYPGGTDRWRTALEVRRAAEIELPRQIAEQTYILDLFAEVAKANPAAGPILEPSRLGIANGMFNSKWTLEAFRRGDVVGDAENRHAALEAWIAKDPARSPYAAALQELRSVLVAGDATRDRDEALGYLGYVGDLVGAAGTLVGRAHEREKPDGKRRLGFQDRDEAQIRARMGSMQRGLELTSERKLVHRYLSRLAVLPDCPPELRTWLALDKAASPQAAVDAAVERLYGKARLADKDYRLSLLELPLAKLEAAAKEDPFLGFALAMRPFQERERGIGRTREGALARLRPLYVEALRQAVPAQAYADANSTLRVTFGTVQGYGPRDGVVYTPQTTLEGVVEKAGAWPFDASPEHLAAIRARKHGPYADPKLGTVPVDFLSDLDITGGNSGSPTIDRNGKLVGLAFDGNVEGIASDWAFDPQYARTIHVDVRYVLWYLDAVAKAPELLKELGQPRAFP